MKCVDDPWGMRERYKRGRNLKSFIIILLKIIKAGLKNLLKNLIKRGLITAFRVVLEKKKGKNTYVTS